MILSPNHNSWFKMSYSAQLHKNESLNSSSFTKKKSGYVALHLARQYPTRVKGLIFVGSVLNFLSAISRLGRCYLSSHLLSNSVLSKWISSDFSTILPQAKIEESILRSGSHFSKFSKVADILEKNKRVFFERLAKFEGPILFIQGDRASDANEEEESQFHNLPNGTAISLRGASELCWLVHLKFNFLFVPFLLFSNLLKSSFFLSLVSNSHF